MTRHIVDQATPVEGKSRARAFLKIDRRIGPSEATKRLQREPRGSGQARLREYLRIEKGRLA